MYTIKIKTDNAAFGEGGEGHELARILRKLASDLEAYGASEETIMDHNGNRVGTVTLTSKTGKR